MTGTLTRNRLSNDLRELGIAPGSIVLVHASLSGLGYVEGGAEAVIHALLDAVGERGTVLFPTLTGAERDGPAHPPRIDLATTPCWTGAIPEAARHHPGARRSIHPTHSVTAIGTRAGEFSSGHESGATPCDMRSPYARLMETGGRILLLGGVSHESNTTLHALEELAGVSYHLQGDVTDGSVRLPDGSTVVVRNRLHLWRWEREFPKVGPILVRAGQEHRGRVGMSESILVSARGLHDTILPLMRRDPLFLLSERARSAFLAEKPPGKGGVE